jgi:hypothetical protein
MSNAVELNYSPVLVKIKDFPRGDTFLPDTFLVKDELGNNIDLTAGYLASMRIEKRDSTIIATLTSAPLGGIALGNGTIEFNVNTSTWPAPCTLYADLQMTTPGGKIETWLRFEIEMIRTITPP